MLVAETDGVDGDALAADGLDGLEVDAAGVVGAVAQQHDGAQRQGGRLAEHALESLADARGGRGAGELIAVFWMRSGSLPNL